MCLEAYLGIFVRWSQMILVDPLYCKGIKGRRDHGSRTEELS